MDPDLFFRGKDAFVTLPAPPSKKRVIVDDTHKKTNEKNESKRSNQFDYAEKYKDFEFFKEDELTQLNDIDNVTLAFSKVTSITNDCYGNYDFSRRMMATLPIESYKNEIISKCNSNKICIISGSTGCGKSTQVPQYILDYHVSQGTWCNIIVTQPRKIAAISVAKRVCEERNWAEGSIVGYQVGLDRKVSDDTRLLYCTTGVLLNKLVTERNLSMYSHIIIDEVHERDQDMDFTLLLLKKLQYMFETKIILMSATADTARLIQYFSNSNPRDITSIHSINVDSSFNFDVDICYLNELSSSSEIVRHMTITEPEFRKELCPLVCTLLRSFDDIDAEDITTAEMSDKGISNMLTKPSVIIFLPGIYEIEELDRYFKEHYNQFSRNIKKPASKLQIHVLHSLIAANEQEMAFKKAAEGHRKVILSTNIGENSITINDAKYVIDFCLMKELNYDRSLNLTHLRLQWCSKSNCKQRTGRVGRVMRGHVYRLIPRELYSELPEYPTPEILRSPLDKLILKAKMLNVHEPKVIFSAALDAPDFSNIEDDVCKLKEMGALMPFKNGVFYKDDGDLTRLGRILSYLPVDLHLGKLIVLGYLFGVYEETIIIACCLSVKNPFTTPFKQNLEAYDAKLFASNSSESDCIALLNIFRVWHRNHMEKSTLSSAVSHQEEMWARKHFVNIKSLKEASKLYDEVKQRLLYSQIEDWHALYNFKLESEQKAVVLKVVLAGAFYPNYFTYNGVSHRIDEREAVKTLGGCSPYNSVYLRGIPREQPGLLYIKLIKERFKNIADEIDVTFDINKGTVYVSFKNAKHYVNDRTLPVIPGKISLAVYRAIKMRQLDKFTISCLPTYEATKKLDELLKKVAEYREISDKIFDTIVYPWDKNGDMFGRMFIEIVIKHVENPSKFWAQLFEKDRIQTCREIEEHLNTDGNLIVVDRIIVGNMYAARYNNIYYRCRVLSELNISRCGKSNYTVFYVDYGNTEIVASECIKGFGVNLLKRKYHQIPDLVVECRLSEIQPKIDCNNMSDTWSSKAVETLNSYINIPLNAKIFSIVNRVMSFIVYKNNSDGTTSNVSLNELLIDENCAIPMNEDYLSQMDHFERLEAECADNKTYKVDKTNVLLKFAERERLSENDCFDFKMDLQGPFNPLEVPLLPTTKSLIGKNVIVERDSVNSVLLNNNLQDQFERLLVAGHVSVNRGSDKLFLRRTTQMVPLRGFSSLMHLLFAPAVELRANKQRTSFTGALCGLGYDPKNNQPLYPENDIEVIFDVRFTLDDIECINRLRTYFNINMSEDRRSTNYFTEQVPVFNYLYRLLKNYEPQEPCESSSAHYKWNTISPIYRLPPIDMRQHKKRSHLQIYQLIWGIELENTITDVSEIYANLDNLNKLLIGENPSIYSTFVCKLCLQKINNQLEARLHVKTRLHNERLIALQTKYPNHSFTLST